MAAVAFIQTAMKVPLVFHDRALAADRRLLSSASPAHRYEETQIVGD